jgi:hypothetical protein
VGHVVVGGEELDLRLAAVDDEDDVVDCHRRFCDVRRQNHFCDAIANMTEDLKNMNILHQPILLIWLDATQNKVRSSSGAAFTTTVRYKFI